MQRNEEIQLAVSIYKTDTAFRGIVTGFHARARSVHPELPEDVSEFLASPTVIDGVHVAKYLLDWYDESRR